MWYTVQKGQSAENVCVCCSVRVTDALTFKYLWACARGRTVLIYERVCLCSILCMFGCECRCAPSLCRKAFQESVPRTWHLCNLWHSKDFQLSVSSCVAKQQREVLPNYKGVKSGCVTLITCLLLPSCLFQWIFRVYIFHLTDLTESYTILGCLYSLGEGLCEDFSSSLSPPDAPAEIIQSFYVS